MDIENLIEMLREFYDDSKFIIKNKKIKKSKKILKDMIKDIDNNPEAINKYLKDEENIDE